MDSDPSLALTVIVWCKTSQCITEMMFTGRDNVCFYGDGANTCSEGSEYWVELPAKRIVRPLYGALKRKGWIR